MKELIEMTYAEFVEWIEASVAIEVDDQYVIYPPMDNDGEMEFKEDEGQEAPYFTATKDWNFHLLAGELTVYSPDKNDEHNIVRLGHMDGSTESDLYAEDNGEHCPKCKSLKVESTSELDHCAHKIYQNCRCIDCGVEFTDIYTLSGMEVLEDDDE
jgi:hypothetical protein